MRKKLIHIQILHLSVAFIRNFFLGITAYFKAVPFIFTHRLYRYAILPFILLILVGYFAQKLQNHQYNPSFETLDDLYWYLLVFILEQSAALFLMKNAAYIVFVLLSPLMTFLSSKTDTILTGKTFPFDWQQFQNDLLRALRLIIRNIIWQYLFLIPLIIVAYIIWGKYADTPMYTIGLMVIGYYCGFSLLDYVNERRKLNVNESVRFVQEHRGLSLAIGGVFIFLLQIEIDFDALLFFLRDYSWMEWFKQLFPFLKELVILTFVSFVPILAISAATLSMHDLVQNEGQHTDNEIS
jgi:CysZ protein